MAKKPKAMSKKAVKKKKVGRPTKYKSAYCERLIKFFDSEPYEDMKIPHYSKTGKKRVVWTDIKRMPNKLPTLRDFAKKIKVSYVTVYAWLKKHEKFFNAFTHAQELRKWFLIQNGLQGLYNPLFAKFTAINVTDMVDKSETEHSGTVKHEIVNFSNVKVAPNNP